jgi:hypothetical protein
VPWQNLSRLADDRGLVEVLENPTPGGTILLRTRDGDPVWSPQSAWIRRTVRSMLST